MNALSYRLSNKSKLNFEGARDEKGEAVTYIERLYKVMLLPVFSAIERYCVILVFKIFGSLRSCCIRRFHLLSYAFAIQTLSSIYHFKSSLTF